MKKVLKFEPILFYLLVILNLIPVINAGLIFSLDGPAHTYNAALLKEFLTGGSNALSDYLEFNPVLIPNWTGHSIMTFFQYFVSPRLSEKLLLLTILILTPISFRFLVKSFAHTQIISPYFIFIFTYNVFQVFGFYNFLLAFIPAFYLLGFFIRKINNLSKGHYFLIGLLLFIIFLSHAFVYLLCLLLLFLYYSLYIWIKFGNGFKYYFIAFFKNAWILMLVALPSLVYFCLFYITKPELHPSFLGKFEITSMLKNNQSLICFTGDEIAYTRPIIYLLSILVFVSFVTRILEFSKNKSFILNDIFPIMLFILLVLLYVLPDSDGWGGFYTLRTLLLINLFMILWVASINFSIWIKFSIWCIMAYFHIMLMINYDTQSKLNQPRLQACHKAGQLVESGKLILPVNATGNWLYGHTALRAATQNKLIALENYEASNNYFPLRWKKSVKAVPVLTNGKIPSNFAWWPWKTSKRIITVDYIFIVGSLSSQPDESYRILEESVSNDYQEIYSEADCYLYKLKKK